MNDVIDLRPEMEVVRLRGGTYDDVLVDVTRGALQIHMRSRASAASYYEDKIGRFSPDRLERYARFHAGEPEMVLCHDLLLWPLAQGVDLHEAQWEGLRGGGVMGRRPRWRLTIRWVGGGAPGIQLHDDVVAAVEACRALKGTRDADPRIEGVRLFAPTGEAVWEVFEEDEPESLVMWGEEEFGGPARTVPYNVPPKGDYWNTLTPYQQGAVTALLAVTATHGFLIGAMRDDHMLPLWFDGKGEFADGRWLIHPDGTPYPEGTMVETPQEALVRGE